MKVTGGEDGKSCSNHVGPGALFEAMISLALLMTAFGDTPSLARVTANGENMLRHLAQPDQPMSKSTSIPSGLFLLRRARRFVSWAIF
jgi:hypothetical protein